MAKKKKKNWQVKYAEVKKKKSLKHRKEMFLIHFLIYNPSGFFSTAGEVKYEHIWVK